MKNNDYDFERFANVSISMNLLLPQDYMTMAGTNLVGELAAAVAAGKIPVQLNISLATTGDPLAVPKVFRELWLRRIAEDEGRTTAVSRLAEDLEVDEEGKLEKRFLVWPMGTPIGDVETWIEGI
jgi:hypothetical protein